ncbi:MAG: MGH1-like glycoside hydrolase domain-containing protein [Sphingomonas sp.]
MLASAIAIAAAAQAQAAPQTTRFPGYDPQHGLAGGDVTVSAQGQPGARVFDLSSTAPQRDKLPSTREIREAAGRPHVATGSALFDALFALAVDEAQQDSVSQIKDYAYNGNQPIPCNCFETGENWHYVWTRDLSYSLDLGLAGYDPGRAVDSLLFKTSPFRAGFPVPAGLPKGSTQIIQDTGSGGSWPVSTDRTAWTLGAERTLDNLTGAARRRFAAQALAALRGTIEADRVAAFDARNGLYNGEESFLDWRDQTYPAWITDHLTHLAQSKALSTNILQLRAMRLAARLAAAAGEQAVAQRYAGWAQQLEKAINATFWDDQAGLYAIATTANMHPARVRKYDLLGNMLAILSGVAGPERGRRILSSYPFAPYGPPVVWPEEPDAFIYHNRAQWPFVTAYTLRAAAAVGHVAAADRAMQALVRAAALHLSNMENLEWLTGRSSFDKGPAMDSRRQLWSVAGYYGAVVGTIFGWQPEADGVHIAPFLTTATRDGFGDQATARLSGVRFGDKRVDVVLHLPARAPAGGVYALGEVRLDGQKLTGAIVPSMLSDVGNTVDVSFGAVRRSSATVTEVPHVDALNRADPRVFMSPTPKIASVTRGSGGPVVTIAPDGKAATFAIYRDGLKVGSVGAARRWVDPQPELATLTVCYAARAEAGPAGTESQPSQPVCLRGSQAQTIAATDPRLAGSARLVTSDAGHGPVRRVALGTTLDLPALSVRQGGTYAISFRYDNHLYGFETGITNAVKRVTLTAADGTTQQAIVQMPHIRPADDKSHPLRQSTRAYVTLRPGRYSLSVDDYFNMSALAANATYNGPGGKAGPANTADVTAILVDPLAP